MQNVRVSSAIWTLAAAFSLAASAVAQNQAPGAQPQAGAASTTQAQPKAETPSTQPTSAATAPAASAKKESLGKEVEQAAMWPVHEAEKGVGTVENTVDPDSKGKVISASQASQTALKAVPGRITKTELEKNHGKPVYEFKIKPQAGKGLKEVHVDAKTGLLINVKKAD